MGPASKLLFVQDNPRRCRDACLCTCRQLSQFVCANLFCVLSWQEVTGQVVVIARGKDPNSPRTVHIALAVEQS